MLNSKYLNVLKYIQGNNGFAECDKIDCKFNYYKNPTIEKVRVDLANEQYILRHFDDKKGFDGYCLTIKGLNALDKARWEKFCFALPNIIAILALGVSLASLALNLLL